MKKKLNDKTIPELAGYFRKEVDQILGYFAAYISKKLTNGPFEILEQLDKRNMSLLDIEGYLRDIEEGPFDRSNIQYIIDLIDVMYERILTEDVIGKNFTLLKSEDVSEKILLPLFLVLRFLKKVQKG